MPLPSTETTNQEAPQPRSQCYRKSHITHQPPPPKHRLAGVTCVLERSTLLYPNMALRGTSDWMMQSSPLVEESMMTPLRRLRSPMIVPGEGRRGGGRRRVRTQEGERVKVRRGAID